MLFVCLLNYFEVSLQLGYRVTIGQAIQAHTAMVMILHYTVYRPDDFAVASSEQYRKFN